MITFIDDEKGKRFHPCPAWEKFLTEKVDSSQTLKPFTSFKRHRRPVWRFIRPITSGKEIRASFRDCSFSFHNDSQALKVSQ
jgi:hypothetical protein